MKTAFIIVLLILAALACGCTASAPAAAPAETPAAEAAIPNLAGTWTGTALGCDTENGFTDYGGAPFSMVVLEQQGRIISGYTLLTLDGTDYKTPMTGVIARDGRTFSIVEEKNGYTTGEITGMDSIELTWRNDRAPASAALDTLKRV